MQNRHTDRVKQELKVACVALALLGLSVAGLVFNHWLITR